MDELDFSTIPTWELIKYQISISKIIADRDVNQISIDDLDISIRCYQSLSHIGIKYLNQLCHLKKSDLVRFKNFSTKSIQEIDEMMLEKGLNWLSL